MARFFFVFLLLIGLAGTVIDYRLMEREPELIKIIASSLFPLLLLATTYLLRSIRVTSITAKVKLKMEKNEQEKAKKIINKKLNSKVFGLLPLDHRANLLALKAMYLTRVENYKKSDKILTDLLKNYPNFIDALYYKACLESIKGNDEKSIKYIKKTFDILNGSLQDEKHSWIQKRGKKLKNFIRLIKTDDDLSDLHGTAELEKILSKRMNKAEEKILDFLTPLFGALVISIFLLVYFWLDTSEIYPLFVIVGGVAVFCSHLIIQKLKMP